MGKKRLLEVSLKDRISDDEYERLKRIQRELMGTEKNYAKHKRRK